MTVPAVRYGPLHVSVVEGVSSIEQGDEGADVEVVTAGEVVAVLR